MEREEGRYESAKGSLNSHGTLKWRRTLHIRLPLRASNTASAEKGPRFSLSVSTMRSITQASNLEKADLPTPASEQAVPSAPLRPVETSFKAQDDAKRRGSWILRGGERPWLLKLRSSEVFITFVVGYGVFVDMFVVCQTPKKTRSVHES